ncbi:hypothetical protein DEU56DRAFT_777137 [Suillus clintonianus]|uniref:uncharacterized protein n=1 Tax=Suillus clintonianus TaxID=1904413 RepID=UPI001B8660C0|nr:uncharacterized protein DEU56DRAFT_777137 [Suillus clintonianus]KAG2151300.1 hypothetical protein DEU56DRAFT_777137 [Suillus clintonianus]
MKERNLYNRSKSTSSARSTLPQPLLIDFAMTSTIYRRQSMATLYEKLRAQDGEDHMAWLAEVTAEFDTEDKPALFVPSVPGPPSVISSGSSSASSSPQNSITSLDFHDQSQGESDSDSDSDSEIELIDNQDGILFQSYDPIQYSPSDFLDHNLDPVADLPYIPPVDAGFNPPLIFGCNAEPQAALTMDPTPPSSFVPQPAPQPMFPAVNNSLPFITRSARSFIKRNPVALHDSDEDAEGQSDSEETDDEYVPSSSRNPKKTIPSHASTYTMSQYISPPAKRARPAPLPRNAQAAPGTAPSFASKSNPWACPYCKWIQRNHRTPDLKRHILTHTRLERPAQWVCCGIPVESATIYNVPHDAAPYIYNGKQMVGGCGKEFSRRDALKRHLGNDHISCIGDIDAFANVYDD